MPTIYKAYVREYPHKIWPYMVQYLHFRILEFPSKKGPEGTNERLQALEMVEVTTGHQSPEGCAVSVRISGSGVQNDGFGKPSNKLHD